MRVNALKFHKRNEYFFFVNNKLETNIPTLPCRITQINFLVFSIYIKKYTVKTHHNQQNNPEVTTTLNYFNYA